MEIRSYRLLHCVADVEVEPQKKIYDEWGRFVARADLWVIGTRRLHPSMTASHIAIEKHIARIWQESGAWSRSTGSASGLRRRSCSSKQAR